MYQGLEEKALKAPLPPSEKPSLLRYSPQLHIFQELHLPDTVLQSVNLKEHNHALFVMY